MKKILILSIFLCASAVVFSKDYLELTPDGLIVKEDPTASYIVLTYEGLSQNDIFSITASYLESELPKNSKEQKMNRITLIPSTSILVNGYGKNVLRKSDNLIYKISIMVKDKKIRIDIPTFSTQPEKLKNEIFTKTGRLIDPIQKKQIENFFNTLISDIDKLLFLSSPENDEENNW